MTAKTNTAPRGVNSTRNAAVAVAVSFVTLAVSFISRTVFIRCLSTEYLGLNSFLINLLTFLTLTDLGMERAFSYALYEPLLRSDTEKIKSIIAVFRRFYAAVGTAVFLAGALLIPALPHLMRELPAGIPLSAIRLYYCLYVFMTGIAYFFSYRRTLIISDQKEYISTLLTGAARTVGGLIQIVILLTTGSFLLYLIVLVVCTVADNAAAYVISNRMYPFIRERDVRELPSGERRVLKRNIPAVFLHKAGGVLVFTTDSLIITRFVGIAEAGLYSNYTAVTSMVNTILNRALTGITASLGNLMADDSSIASKEKVFYHVLFVNTWVYGWASLCLFCLLQPFIRIWIGEQYLLSFATVLLAVISFYLTGVRMTVLLFKSASGLFRPDRYKPLVESAVNIAVSIPLAIRFGVPGVLAGTIASTLLIAFWFEALVLFRDRFQKGIGRYLLTQLGYLSLNGVLTAVCFFLCRAVPSFSFPAFLCRLLICLTVPNLVWLLLFRKTENLLYLRKLVTGVIRRLRRGRKHETTRTAG